MAETDVVRLELTADLAEVGVARRFVRTNLTDVPASVSTDAQLVASELVTNAVEHGAGGPVVVALRRNDDAVALTVESEGPASDVGDVAEWRIAPIDQPSGRGLGIIRAIAHRVDVEQTDGRLVITVNLPI